MVAQPVAVYGSAPVEDVESASTTEDSKSDVEGPGSRRNCLVAFSTRSMIVGLVGTALVLACAGYVYTQGSASDDRAVADTSASVNLVGATEFGDSVADGFDSVADALDDIQNNYKQVTGAYKNLTAQYGEMNKTMYDLTGDIQGPMHKLTTIRMKFRAMNATAKAAFKAKMFKKYNITSFSQLKIIQKLHDGNVCLDDEELFGSLCYAKCSELTGGTFPFRTTAFTCCMVETGCGYENSKTEGAGAFGCEGYNVAGKIAGSVCPHSPGACLATEEFRHNVCYKKCALLTFNKLPYREAANTCCLEKAGWGALDLGKCVTKPGYAVGGGDGDGHPGTPDTPHPAIAEYTEMPNKTKKACTYCNDLPAAKA